MAFSEELQFAIDTFKRDNSLRTVIEAAGITLYMEGGEAHGPCPVCKAGHDRFFIRSDGKSAYCRRCQHNGDALRWAMLLDGYDPKERGAVTRYLAAKGYLRNGNPNARQTLRRGIPQLRIRTSFDGFL